MTDLRFPFSIRTVILACSLIFLASLVLAIPAGANAPAQETESYCLSCHSNPELSLTLPSGETLSLYIDPAKLADSLHSPLGIECEACHTDITGYPHPEIAYQNRRELARSYYQACQKCHTDQYDKTLDSMHAQVAEGGNLEAPVCTDCHGSHYVTKPDEPRATVSQTCGHCHTDIYDAYKLSIHGDALINQDNPDVPVCTDCHGVHNIHDPRTSQFRVAEPELCAGCHADATLMGKYDLSADVYNQYKTSWHGVDVTVYQAKWPTIWHDTAICSDCHGIHNILPADNPASTVNPDNLLTTCQKCHPGVSENWTGAWTGHYEISLERNPFVYYVDLFYSSLAPAVLWLSAIYVVLQILRNTVARARRSL
ncbi:MAG: cytochrome c3 family protein [Anaerolineales bacterium]|nr:cytochrome c3 family protein [Anaerolineales bacterium]